MGRFETEWLATDENLAVLTDLSGVWIDRVHDRKRPKTIILNMDSSESPTYGERGLALARSRQLCYGRGQPGRATWGISVNCWL